MDKLSKISTIDLAHLPAIDPNITREVFGSFLDAAVTATARATFYNTREQQEKVTSQIHERLFKLNRGIYGLMLLLPGITDYTRQSGVIRLLSHPFTEQSILTPEQETRLITWLIQQLPIPRILNLFTMLQQARVNNSRTRKLILGFILNSGNLEFWAVKYRHKIAHALKHAWGEHTTGIVKAILTKSVEHRTAKENSFLDRNIGKFIEYAHRQDKIFECVKFILGLEQELTLPLLISYYDAKQDLEKGNKLPYEVLEGLRSQYHPDRKSGEVLQLTRQQLTTGQQIALQRKAQTEAVQLSFDPAKYDAVRLYLYAYEMGMTNAIKKELQHKASKAAKEFPVPFNRIGILIDTSASMTGHVTQKNRPIATALATRDLLVAACNHASVYDSNGRTQPDFTPVTPAGDTSLARGLVMLMLEQPEAIFILTDGYENAPAGRVNEVIGLAKKLNINIPIYQISMVMASEAKGLRLLSEGITAIPLHQPEAIGIGLVKLMLLQDFERGIAGLLKLTLPKLEEMPVTGKLPGTGIKQVD